MLLGESCQSSGQVCCKMSHANQESNYAGLPLVPIHVNI